MRPEMERLIECYGTLEQQVRRKMERLCRPFCSNCRAVCCRVHFCVETLESVFLKQVTKRFSPGSRFHSAKGWLSSSGCTLVAGRPPVCYEYLCGKISNSLDSDPRRRHALFELSMVMTHAGTKVVGRRHVVEAMHTADLNRIRPDRFINRLKEAETIFLETINTLDGS